MAWLSEYLNLSDHPGVLLILLGCLLFSWSLRRLAQKSRETRKKLQKKTEPKDWI
jgi:preprotein translocase subunit SecY